MGLAKPPVVASVTSPDPSAFATAINTGANAGNGCALSLGGTIPGTFGYQTTNPATNAVTGTPNTAASIAAGGVQSFVFGIARTAS